MAEPRFGRVAFVDVSGLSIFETAERGARKRCLMVFVRGQNRPLLVEVVKIGFQDLAFQGDVPGTEKLRGSAGCYVSTAATCSSTA